jgi:hypothetical protein
MSTKLPDLQKSRHSNSSDFCSPVMKMLPLHSPAWKHSVYKERMNNLYYIYKFIKKFYNNNIN